MKVVFFAGLALFGLTVADHVRRPSFQRQTVSAAKPGNPEPESEPAPYPASGWKPSGPQFQYGPPVPAEPTTTESPETSTAPPEAAVPARLQQKPDGVTGVYYVLQEDGRLQQVVFVAEPERQQQRQHAPARLQVHPAATAAEAVSQARSARIQLQLKDVEPIRGPVYAYSPLQRILRQA